MSTTSTRSTSTSASTLANRFKELFAIRGPQAGGLTAFRLSPSGMRILSATSQSLAIIDTRVGKTVTVVNTGEDSHITAGVWLTNAKCVLGCKTGHLYMASFRSSNSLAPTVSIVHAFQDLNKHVRALEFSIAQKLLVIGYEDSVSIWHDTPSEWELVERIPMLCMDGPGLKTIKFFGRIEQMLFIGGGFGHVIWTAPGKADFFTNERRAARIDSAMSPDGNFLAVSTLDQHVYMWPIITGGVRPSTNIMYHLATGIVYWHINPRVPVAVTQSGLAVAGSQVGELSFTRSTGVSAAGFFFEYNASVMGLLTHGDRLYASYMGPSGCVMTVGYSDKLADRRAFTKLQDEHKTHVHAQTVNINISQIPVLPHDDESLELGYTEPLSTQWNAYQTRPPPKHSFIRSHALAFVTVFISSLTVVHLADKYLSAEMMWRGVRSWLWIRELTYGILRQILQASLALAGRILVNLDLNLDLD